MLHSGNEAMQDEIGGAQENWHGSPTHPPTSCSGGLICLLWEWWFPFIKRDWAHPTIKQLQGENRQDWGANIWWHWFRHSRWIYLINSVNKPLCPRIKKWQIVTSKIHGNRKKKLDVFLSNPKKQNMHRALFSISLPKVSRSTTTSSYNLNVPCSEKSPLLLSSRGRVPPAPALRCSSDRRFNGRGRIKHYNDI